MRHIGSRSWVIALLAASAAAGFAASAESATGVALLALATIPALFAVPARGRPALGVVVGAGGLVAAVLGDLGGAGSAAAVGIVGAGLLIAFRGVSWTGLARRYDETPASRQSAEPVDLWRALDRGEDPTGPNSPGPDSPGPGGGRSSPGPPAVD